MNDALRLQLVKINAGLRLRLDVGLHLAVQRNGLANFPELKQKEWPTNFANDGGRRG